MTSVIIIEKNIHVTVMRKMVKLNFRPKIEITLHK